MEVLGWLGQEEHMLKGKDGGGCNVLLMLYPISYIILTDTLAEILPCRSYLCFMVSKEMNAPSHVYTANTCTNSMYAVPAARQVSEAHVTGILAFHRLQKFETAFDRSICLHHNKHATTTTITSSYTSRLRHHAVLQLLQDVGEPRSHCRAQERHLNSWYIKERGPVSQH